MIVSIDRVWIPTTDNVSPGDPNRIADMSQVLDRKGNFSVEATIGNRMDICHMTFQDSLPAGRLAIPDRAEVVIYDAAPGSAVTDPPNAVSYYNKYLNTPYLNGVANGAGQPVTSSTPSAWTRRIFAGYVAKASYSVEGPQRYVSLSAQDYTYRLRTTVCNMAFAAGYSDQYIIQQLFAKYRTDIDTSGVGQIVANFPNISFPAHTLEQFMQRILRVSRGFYRIDYYKRLTYGILGTLVSPVNYSDTPDFSNTFPTENLVYEPDGTGLVNKVWIIGGSFLSGTQTYQVPTGSVDGTHYQFALPGDPEPVGMTVTVAGVSQGAVGVAPGDGDPANQAGFKKTAIVQHAPAVLLLKTTPASGTVIQVQGKFRYPLIQTVSDPSLISAAGGLIFEGIVRDRRIVDLTLAQQVGKNYLTQQGRTIKGGSFLTKYWRAPTGQGLLTPGMQATIKHGSLYAGVLTGGGTTNTVVVTKTTLRLSEDVNQPYEMTVDYSDRHVGGGL